MSKRLISTTGLVILVVFFMLLTILINQVSGFRIDLTEQKLYTLSPGTKNILKNIDEPINLYYFYSESNSKNAPELRNFAQRIKELLEEYTKHSQDKLKLNIIDPEPFSEAEDLATQFGIQGIPINNFGEKIYLGLAATNALDSEAVIPFFQMDKEELLEYDISKLVYELAKPTKPVIGVITQLPIQGGLNPLSRQTTPTWFFMQQLEQLFQIQNLTTEIESISEDIDALLVIHPKSLPDITLYAIDQYILQGGKLLAFVDPHSEMDKQSSTEPTATFQSSLDPLFKQWGIGFDINQVASDQLNALTVRQPGSGQPVRHVAIMGYHDAYFDQQDPITTGLASINISTAGFLTPLSKDIEFTPLLTTSEESMLIPSEQFASLTDPASLLDTFKASGENYILGARITGQFKSAFPDGSPVTPLENDPIIDGDKETITLPHINVATQVGHIIVFADTDMLADRMWVSLQNFFGQTIPTKLASNGDLVFNAMDHLVGSEDLISIRSRGRFSRPFEKVQALQLEAETSYRAKEQQLLAQLKEADMRLAELQSQRENTQSLVLTPEQEATLKQFALQRNQIRKELREVQHQLNQKIEFLGTFLKIVNIGLMPVLVILLAFLARHMRRRQRLV